MKGLVLAGGESRRFGRDKASAPWNPPDPETFAQRAHRVLSHVVGETWISCRENSGVTWTERLLFDDSARAEGPGAGLRAAHRKFPHETWFVLACDFPFAEEACIEFLKSRWRPSLGALTFRSGEGHFEPLLGIWSPVVLQGFLEDPLPSPQRRLRESGVCTVECPEPKWLTNVNSPLEA